MSTLSRENDSFVYVETQQLFCDDESCFSMSEDGTLYSDGDHISRLGAELIVDEIERLIVEIERLIVE
ncbi:MAG: hypothetical protein HRT81_17255 [Henriciella sp.]|nr:hypothetical protein [Henriciella sp.]